MEVDSRTKRNLETCAQQKASSSGENMQLGVMSGREKMIPGEKH